MSVLEPVKTEKTEGDDEEISYEEAVRRREERELEEAKMLCSLENKEACLSTFRLLSVDASVTVTDLCSSLSTTVCSG